MMSPERRKLQDLESTGRYVFHGSGEELDVLEPQQAHNRFDGKAREDGPPAVFATNAADYAVFMAVFSRRNCPLGRHTSVGTYSYKDGTYDIRFKASPETMSQIDDRSSGWVYAFDKSSFVLREPGGLEYTVRKSVSPLERIPVKKADILGSIEVV